MATLNKPKASGVYVTIRDINGRTSKTFTIYGVTPASARKLVKSAIPSTK